MRRKAVPGLGGQADVLYPPSNVQLSKLVQGGQADELSLQYPPDPMEFVHGGPGDVVESAKFVQGGQTDVSFHSRAPAFLLVFDPGGCV